MIMGKGDCYEEKYNPDDRMEKLYPIKKGIIVSVWLFAVIILYAGFRGLIEDHDLKTIVVIILDGAILVKSFRPVKNYLLQDIIAYRFLIKFSQKKNWKNCLREKCFGK